MSERDGTPRNQNPNRETEADDAFFDSELSLPDADGGGDGAPEADFSDGVVDTEVSPPAPAQGEHAADPEDDSLDGDLLDAELLNDLSADIEPGEPSDVEFFGDDVADLDMRTEILDADLLEEDPSDTLPAPDPEVVHDAGFAAEETLVAEIPVDEAEFAAEETLVLEDPPEKAEEFAAMQTRVFPPQTPPPRGASTSGPPAAKADRASAPDAHSRATSEVDAVRGEFESGSWSAAYQAVDADEDPDVDPEAFEESRPPMAQDPLDIESLQSESGSWQTAGEESVAGPPEVALDDSASPGAVMAEQEEALAATSTGESSPDALDEPDAASDTESPTGPMPAAAPAASSDPAHDPAHVTAPASSSDTTESPVVEDPAAASPPLDSPAAALPAADTPASGTDLRGYILRTHVQAAAPAGDEAWLQDHGAFRDEGRRLARAMRWRELAALSATVAEHASFAQGPARAAILLDLARLYRDRLRDEDAAAEAFEALLSEDAAQGEALDYLADLWQRRQRSEALYALALRATESAWDPDERLRWTRQAARVAVEELGQPSLAIRAWEQLWELGDAALDAGSALAALYRMTGRWSDLAAFLARQAERIGGGAAALARRELAEVQLYALGDLEGATSTLEALVAERGLDAVSADLLVRIHARAERWDALEALADAPATSPAESRRRALRIALAFEEAGEDAHLERTLERLGADPEARRLRRALLERQGREAELADLLERIADAHEPGDPARHEPLRRAAELRHARLNQPAEALRLLQALREEEGERPATLEAIAALQQTLGQQAERATTLERLLLLRPERLRRVALLFDLAQLRHALGEAEAAAAHLRDLLHLEPDHDEALSLSIALQREAGDDEALLRTLRRSAELASTPEARRDACVATATHVDRAFSDDPRSLDAWLRVLDDAPDDPDACARVAELLPRAGHGRVLSAWLAARAATGSGDRAALLDRLSAHLAAEGDAEALLGAAEVRYATDGEEGSLSALIDLLRDGGHMERAREVLQAHARAAATPQERVRALTRLLAMLPDGEQRARFDVLRALWCLGERDASVRDALVGAALALEATEDLEGLLRLDLPPEGPERAERVAALADLLETRAGQPLRAFLLRQSEAFDPALLAGSRDALLRLAEDTDRHEDALALLARLVPLPASGAEALDAHVRICAEKLNASLRALWALRTRLVAAQASERAPLLERFTELATATGHEAALADLLHDLSFLASQRDDRLAHVASERALRLSLEEQSAAEALTQIQVRLAPADTSLRAAFFALLDERGSDAWRRRMPLLEGVLRAGADPAAPEEALLTLATLHEERAERTGRALDLAAEALLLAPTSTAARTRVLALAEALPPASRALLLRLAAGRVPEPAERVPLLEAAIAVAHEAGAAGPAIELTRRLHVLEPENLEALRALIEAERDHGDPHTLRRLLRRLMLHEEDADARIAAHLEIADLCAAHLDDREGAFAACAAVLEDRPDHEGALERLNRLMEEVRDPALRLRHLQLQLSHAEGSEATRIQLAMATLQEESLDDADGAANTLLDLLTHTDTAPEAVRALRRLLPALERHADHARLLAAAARDGDLDALDEVHTLLRAHPDALPADELRALLGTAVEKDGALRHWRALGALELAEGEGGLERLAARCAKTPAPAPLQAAFAALLEALQVPAPETLRKRWEQETGGSSPLPEALWGLAALAAADGDPKTHVELRARAARLLKPADAALHFCHLAEVAQENEALRGFVVSYYREARGLDPENPCAREALRGIGRRLRTLRPAAALLPEEGEEALGPRGRAARLRERAEEARVRGDAATAREEVRRALAVDPDVPEAWALRAALAKELGAPEEATFALGQGLAAEVRRAHLRGEAPAPERMAERLRDLAGAAEASGERSGWRELAEEGWLLTPQDPEAILLLCRALLADGEEDALLTLLDGVPAEAGAGDAQLRAEVLALRGRALRQAGREEEAQASLRAALALAPLHRGALRSLAALLDAEQAAGSALELHLRALAVEPDAVQRARHYHEAGRLFEDGLKLVDEAGAAFEYALRDGLDSRDLQQRVLRHCMRDGQQERALAMVEALLPGTHQPDELAELWLVRGRILGGIEGREAEAIEAFDMALSYDPARNDVRRALAEVIERRKDWPALLELLEAIAEGGDPQDGAEALLHMATIAEERLHDRARAEALLRRSVERAPTAEGVERLLAMVGSEADPALAQSLRERQVAMGPPWYAPAQALGQLLLGSDAHRAWCVLAPAMLVREADDALRSTLRDLRRTHERPLLLVPGEEGLRWLEEQRPTGALDRIAAQLAGTLDDETLLGPVAGGGEATEISPHAAMGRAFASICKQLGLQSLRLVRDESQRQPLRVARDAEGDRIGVRPDLLPHLTRAEVGYALVSRLFLLTGGRRLAALAGPARRTLLLEGIWAALELHEGGDEAAALGARIREAVDEETLDAWTESLGELGELPATEVATTWWTDLERDSRLCGIVAGADLLQIWRLHSVMYEDLDRPMAFQSFEAVDEWAGGHPHCVDLLVQACSERFASLAMLCEEC